ncbi:glycosyltransferase [Bacteroides sp. AN502(2024)]|uniref:glycosyltransferase n=1 Tax=Bacteroides sp. AN502(2024) TaxID=3160599 RepID=UPI003514ED46
MMKFLQTIAGMRANLGGTSTCTYDLIKTMHNLGCNVDLMTFQADDLLGNNEQWMKTLPDDSISSYGYSRNMNRFLYDSNYDVYHTNGMWMHCNHITCSIARRKDKPYIITLHGMLYPQALARSTWKKKLLLTAGGVAKDLKNAACIHVTCKEEMEHYRALGYKNPVAVIPNPVTIPDFISDITAPQEKKNIGYLGRLHPYKRPDALIKAWAQLAGGTEGCELVLMGKGTDDYEQYLHNLVAELQLTNVSFLGMVTGEEKYKKLASMRALCVPSKTENFGMTVAEALIARTPVICTNTAPWEELNKYHCGWWVDNDIETLARTIRIVLQMPQCEIEKMGGNGKLLVESKYKDTQVAAMMKRLYEWILTSGEKPEFVYE